MLSDIETMTAQGHARKIEATRKLLCEGTWKVPQDEFESLIAWAGILVDRPHITAQDLYSMIIAMRLFGSIAEGKGKQEGEDKVINQAVEFGYIYNPADTKIYNVRESSH